MQPAAVDLLNICICPKHTLHIKNKIFIKHIYENLRRGGIESQGLFQSQEKFLESVNSVKSDKPKKCLLKMFEKTETEILLVILRSGN